MVEILLLAILIVLILIFAQNNRQVERWLIRHSARKTKKRREQYDR